MHHRTNLLVLIVALGALAPALTPPAPPAQAAAPAPPQLTPVPGGLRIEWAGAPEALRALRAGRDPGALATIGGVRLPAQLIALTLAGDAQLAPQIEQLASEPWAGPIVAAQPPTPRLADGAARPDLAAPADPRLPTSPVVVLREARQRGVRLAVLALSPLFSQGGQPRAVTALRLSIPNAEPLPEGDQQSAVGSDTADCPLPTAGCPFLAAAPPGNPAAGVGWKVKVSRAGIQRLPAATLSAAGVPLGNPALLHLYYQGSEVPIEQRGSGAGLELRFYAGPPGDRWNTTDTYWLTAEGTPGLRMATRSVAPGSAPLSAYVLERGTWRGNTFYDSLLPGPDADHWFAADLRTGPGSPAATLTAVITPALTLAAGPATVTVTGSSYLNTAHTLRVTLGANSATATWSGTGDWARTIGLPQPARPIVLTLPASNAPDGYEIDHVVWEFAATLDLKGRGAAFDGRAGTWRYQPANLPAGATLYDITSPLAPVLLGTLAGPFEDGPAARSYLLAGDGTLFTPTVAKSQPFDFATPARALYIAPAALQSVLGPLVARRQAQGYSTRIIDAQAIYDRWSYGRVAPAAIRDFLRHAATWSTPPLGVTLVGDGTADPHNYTGRNNTNYIPPYLAQVDPWLGETACETCFARLDGENPLTDLLPDVALGRLPARSPAELTALVSKLLAYEASPFDIGWRSRVLYVADNYRDPSGQPDGAGDFAAFAEASILDLPQGILVKRLYYDPSPNAPAESWREKDALAAYQRTHTLLSAGAGIVNYVGHGSQYQWAVTDYNQSPPYLLGQYDPDSLTNGARQPIVLEMTCLTGAFQTPSFGGTIDERLLLRADGGAIAVWGPTGQGVAHGHDALQRGFYQRLWALPPLSARLGDLTLAGYGELFANGQCCEDAISTFALLGDALMPARVMPAKVLYVPMARRVL